MSKTRTTNDLKKDIEDILVENKKFYHFVKWYCTSQQDEKSYDKIRALFNGAEFEYAMENYLCREDVQNAIKLWVKKNKDINMIKVYNAMLEKSLTGDTKSAEWLMKFNNSSFFKEEEDSEVHELLNGLNIPAYTEQCEANE